jgi:predicted enzyme related to lactoylglutathione lyase
MAETTDALTLARQREAEVVGVSYVRIASPDLARQTDFYQRTFGLVQIGGFLDHSSMFNVGATEAEGVANPAVRVILDRRMKPNTDNPFVFAVRGVPAVLERAVRNGAKVEMEPLIAGNGFVVAKFTDPAGNWIEILEEGSDSNERLYTR